MGRNGEKKKKQFLFYMKEKGVKTRHGGLHL
jgi:hypothetical protein